MSRGTKSGSSALVRMFYRMLIFAIAGPFFEVFLNAWVRFFLSEKGNAVLFGGVSLYMMPVWSLMGCVLPVITHVTKSLRFHFLLRVLAYTVTFLAIEYFAGWFYRQFGLHIWDYSHLKYHLHGLICLEYAIPWFFICLAAESIYNRVDAMAWTLTTGLSVKDLENRYNG